MSWNYRLVHVENEILLCSVYYDDWTHEPTARSISAEPIVFYEDESVETMAAMIQKAFEQPVLEDSIFDNKVVF
jgi:hypothetical protein